MITTSWRKSEEWRYRRYTGFSAASFPFFFKGENSLREQSFVGDEIDESKNAQLPALRKNLTCRLGGNCNKSELRKATPKRQMPKMSRLQNLERLSVLHRLLRNNSTVLLQRLWDSVFKAIATQASFSFFLWSNQEFFL
jgi:hypothetical protein